MEIYNKSNKSNNELLNFHNLNQNKSIKFYVFIKICNKGLKKDFRINLFLLSLTQSLTVLNFFN